MMVKYKVEYVKRGIANRFPGNRIEIHRGLLNKKYKKLHREILIHERKHTGEGWDIQDLILDLQGIENRKQYWNFVITHPSSWIQFSPFYYSKGIVYWDITLIVTYLFLFGILLVSNGIVGLITS